MSTGETASQDVVVEIDEASLQASLYRVRGLMYEVNSVRNLALDVERMASSPNLSDAFWLGIQANQTMRRIGQLPETLAGLGGGISTFGAGALAFAMTPIGALTVGAVAAASVVGGLMLSDMEKRRLFDEWQKIQQQTAKQQGLTP